MGVKVSKSLKLQYAELEQRRLKLCAERATVKPEFEDDHAAYEYMGELDGEIEEIEKTQDAIRGDIDHLVNGPDGAE